MRGICNDNNILGPCVKDLAMCAIGKRMSTVLRKDLKKTFFAAIELNMIFFNDLLNTLLRNLFTKMYYLQKKWNKLVFLFECVYRQGYTITEEIIIHRRIDAIAPNCRLSYGVVCGV